MARIMISKQITTPGRSQNGKKKKKKISKNQPYLIIIIITLSHEKNNQKRKPRNRKCQIKTKNQKETKLNASCPAVNLTRLLRMRNQQPKSRPLLLTLPQHLPIIPNPQINISIREDRDLVAPCVPPATDLGDDFADGFVI